MVSSGLSCAFSLNQRIAGTVLAVAAASLLWVMIQRWPGVPGDG